MPLNTFAGSGQSYFSNKVKGELDANFATLTTATASRAGAGAVPLTASIVEIASDGVDALTLADGYEGQHLYLVMITDAGDATLTPTNPANFATLTFDVKDSAHLLFTNGEWYYMGGNATVA